MISINTSYDNHLNLALCVLIDARDYTYHNHTNKNYKTEKCFVNENLLICIYFLIAVDT